ncbi:MAG: MAM protein, partial [Bacteroidetes bacterium]
LPIGIKTNKEGLATIRIDALENIDDNTNIFVYDKTLSTYHDLRAGNYEFFLTIGEHLDRFEIVFSNNITLSNVDNEFESLDTYFSNSSKNIIIINPTLKNIKSVELINMLGQSIYDIKDIPNENYSEFKTKHISSGTYIIKLKTETGTLTKKVLVK